MEHLSSGEVPNETPEPKRRKRIYLDKTKILKPIDDPHEFVQNKCSFKAKKVKSKLPSVVFDLWFDKHYQDRHQFGDENGEREGIEPEIVGALVTKSLSHLVAYSSILDSFSFINNGVGSGRAKRVVLQEDDDNGSKLNVVIEAHLVDIDTYEITVKTAIRKDDFELSDGQFAIQIVDNESDLFKYQKKQLVKVYSL